MKRSIGWILVVAVLALPAMASTKAGSSAKGGTSRQTPQIRFYNVRQQTEEFIGYNKWISLTPEQQRIKTQALSSIPAPCCSKYSMATCCCPCNLAKSVWGLANHLIAEKRYDAPRVKQAVLQWIRFTNPNGSAGNACFQGRCGRAFREDGCGGMDEATVRF